MNKLDKQILLAIKIVGINHGEYSVKVLFEDGLIRNFIQEECYDEIIRKAVYNHNRAHIEPNLTEKEELFCKIIMHIS